MSRFTLMENPPDLVIASTTTVTMASSYLGVIYKITNNINGKVYIGQTINPIESRFRAHCNKTSSRYQSKLYYAIKKYGKESFSIEVLEKGQTKEELDSKEMSYISSYNSVSTGYNIRVGGHTSQWNPESLKKMTEAQILRSEKLKTPVLHLDCEFNIIQRFESVKDAERNLNAKITKYFKFEAIGFRRGFLVKECDLERSVAKIKDIIKDGHKFKHQRVQQISLVDGSVINEFDTMTEAAAAVGGKKTNISAVCRGKKPTCRGYFWKKVN